MGKNRRGDKMIGLSVAAEDARQTLLRASSEGHGVDEKSINCDNRSNVRVRVIGFHVNVVIVHEKETRKVL